MPNYPLHVLVLEDHPFQRLMASGVVESLGVDHITKARDGADALGKICVDPQPVDIVICDLKMDGMDGIEFIRHVATEKLANAVILASVLEDELQRSVEDMAKAYGIEVLGRLDKPLTRDALQTLFERYSNTQQPGRRPHRRQGPDELSAREIREALQHNHIQPFFQPKVSTATGELRGVEALARWQHPQHGLISPGTFLPVIEHHDLVDELTWTMLEQVVARGKRWQQAGLTLPISVNFSAITLQKTDTVSAILNSIGRFPTHLLTIEVTETAVADSPAAMLETLSRLRMRGFGLSIDDYGTGYSSMQQLSKIPFTEVKIDRAFVAQLDNVPKNRAIVNSTLKLAGELNLGTVAEGVEREAERQVLRELGCELIQGFIVARPMTGDDFEDWASQYRTR